MIKRRFKCGDWNKNKCEGKPCNCTVFVYADSPSRCLFDRESCLVNWVDTNYKKKEYVT